MTALSVIAVTSFAVRGVAGALPQSFKVSPSSGPPGTPVEVSGTGCSPGVTVTQADYVKVSSTILGLSTDIPVAANGSWDGLFTVPGNAIGAGPVLAVCFTDGFSLTTIYEPQSFIVTGNPPPTTTTPTTARQTTITPPPGPGTTAPGGTPTTQPTKGSTPGSTGGDGTPGGGNPGGGSPGGGGTGGPGGSVALPGGSGTTGSTGDNSGGSTSGVIAKPAGSKAGATASAAGLRDPRLASSTSSHGDGGSLWVLWLVLIALAAAALTLLWWWQHREPGEADPASDMT